MHTLLFTRLDPLQKMMCNVYVTWTHGPQLLNLFHQWLNNIIPGIKLSANPSEHGTEFLE